MYFILERFPYLRKNEARKMPNTNISQALKQILNKFLLFQPWNIHFMK